MTFDDLKQLLSSRTLRALNPHLIAGPRPPSVVQEQQGDIPKLQEREAVHRDKTGVQNVDGKGHPRFAVTITFLVSDNRRRDIDGCASTVLDCLVKALHKVR